MGTPSGCSRGVRALCLPGSADCGGPRLEAAWLHFCLRLHCLLFSVCQTLLCLSFVRTSLDLGSTWIIQSYLCFSRSLTLLHLQTLFPNKLTFSIWERGCGCHLVDAILPTASPKACSRRAGNTEAERAVWNGPSEGATGPQRERQGQPSGKKPEESMP